MTKGFHKKKSKRILAKRRYKIEKRVREHNRKLRRNAKKNPKNKRKSEIDKLGVPSSAPFKEDVLREAREEKEKMEEMRRLRREELAKKRNNDREVKKQERRGLEEMTKEAEERLEQFEGEEEMDTSEAGGSVVRNVAKYTKEFQKVIEAADVIVQVLDARDPLGSRSPLVEQSVIAANKRLILLLNKIDLIPLENLKSWIKYLRNEFPTLPFKANTQNQKNNLGRTKKLNQDNLQSSKCAGVDLLMKILGNYCRNKGIRTSINVGFVGLPNVGKSSIINSLKRSRVCAVGATPGMTKSMQTVALDKHIRLIDCPGVVFSNKNDDSGMALRNAIKIESLDDFLAPIEAIFKKVSGETLMLHYKLPSFNDTNEFLCLLAKRTGKLKKGGVPDCDAVAKKVLGDWNAGKIKYSCWPPEASKSDSHLGAEIVENWSQEFSISEVDMDLD